MQLMCFTNENENVAHRNGVIKVSKKISQANRQKQSYI